MQFFRLVQKGELHDQDVLNIHWYRRDIAGAPTAAACAALIAAFRTSRLPDWLNGLSQDYALRQFICNAFTTDWTPSPYLPTITEETADGVIAQESSPPILAGIVRMLVEPRVLARRKDENDVITLSPVRRGYMAVSGIPKPMHQANGMLHESAGTTNPLAQIPLSVSASLVAADSATPHLPIRVSVPLEGEIARGYGDILGAVWSFRTSARRSRKVGVGG